MSLFSRIPLALLVIVLALSSRTALAATPEPTSPGTPPIASPTVSGDPYAKEFAEARNRATSDFERAVLADDLITHAEYAEAVDRFVTCMQDAGYDFVAVPGPDVPGMWWYESRIPDVAMQSTPVMEAYSADQKEDFDRCSEGTTFVIEALYGAILTNPTNADRTALIVTCFQRTGLAESDYTAADFAANFAREGGTFPFPESDRRFGSCVNNPNQTGLPLQISEPDPRMLPGRPLASPEASPAP